MFWWIMKKIIFWLWAGWVASYLQRSFSAQVNGGGGGGGGPDATSDLWKQPFSAVRASGSYHGNVTSSSMITSKRRWAWWKSRMKTSASSPQTRTWDVFVNLAARASQNTFQVLVHVDDADVFLVFLHHAHHPCEVVMKLTARGRNISRCINISQPARKIGQQVSAIFAVVLFRIDQRLLITISVPISILGAGMSSSSGLPFVRWLSLYDNRRPERRGEAFPAEWSRSSRCFCASKRDGIAPRFCLLQVVKAHTFVV